jgi:hypothetical protein
VRGDPGKEKNRDGRGSNDLGTGLTEYDCGIDERSREAGSFATEIEVPAGGAAAAAPEGGAHMPVGTHPHFHVAGVGSPIAVLGSAR